MEAADILSQTVDKTQMPPLHQKRILAFINHFIIQSCSFLNEFATKCESKFIEIERKMDKVESALTIIEAKLASIPDTDLNKIQDTKAKTTTTQNASQNITETQTQPVKETENAEDENVDAETTNSEVETTVEVGIRACDDLRYKKYFKMVQFGVPAQAVKLKMKSEGLNPAILDTPNLILPDGIDS